MGIGRGKEWRELPLACKLRVGDRVLYVDHHIGRKVTKDELHLTVGQAGYFEVVRKRKKKGER